MDSRSLLIGFDEFDATASAVALSGSASAAAVSASAAAALSGSAAAARSGSARGTYGSYDAAV